MGESNGKLGCEQHGWDVNRPGSPVFNYYTALSLSIVLHGNTYVKNAWRMQNKNKDKWYIIYAKTAEVKKEWMEAFEQERTRVQEDVDKGTT